MAAAAERRADTDRATRRQFFRVFGRQTVDSASSMIAGVEAVRRTSRDAVDDLLGPGETPGTTPAAPASAVAGGASGRAAFRSPYRYTGSVLEILDQAALPARAPVIECRAASEVASAIRQGALSGGPVLGQVAGYTFALVAAQDDARSVYGRFAALQAAADTLAAALPINRAVEVATQRAIARATAAAEAPPERLAAEVLDEADRIANEAATEHARLGSVGALALGRLVEAATGEGRPLAVLMHGDHGPLTGGHVGPGAAVLQTLIAGGEAVHAWLTEAAPLLEGRRAAWALAHLDVPHTLVPDTALGWLLASRHLDAVLLRAERVAANGDLVAPLGSLIVAQAARAAGVPVLGVAPLSLFDPAMPDGESVAERLRVPPTSGSVGARLDPLADVVPDYLLEAVLTEEGELRPPLGPALAAAAASGLARHGEASEGPP